MEEDALEVHNSAKSREYIYMYILLIGSVEIKGFPKKTPVSQKPKIFLIYSAMIRKVK